MHPRERRYTLWISGLVSLLLSDAARACSVCFGNPDHPMSKGAAAGVMVLGGFITFVLLGFVGTGLFWIHRGRALARQQRAASGDPS